MDPVARFTPLRDHRTRDASLLLRCFQRALEGEREDDTSENERMRHVPRRRAGVRAQIDVVCVCVAQGVSGYGHFNAAFHEVAMTWRIQIWPLNHCE